MTNFKGQADLFWIFVFVFILGLISFFALFLLNAFHTGAPMLFNSTTGNSIYHNGQAASNMFDTLIVLVLMGAVLASAISGSQVETSPAFAFLGLFVIIVAIIISVMFHNIYFTIIQQGIFSGTTPSGNTSLMFQYFPLFALVAWFIIMIATYGHGGGGGGASRQTNYG